MEWIKTKEVRQRVFYTILIIAVFQVGTFIPLPYIEHTNSSQNTLNGLLNLTTGGALSRFGLLMLGISPYITASILVQILQKTIPSWKRKAQQAEGRSQIGQYQRLITMLFAFAQSFGLLFNQYMATQLGVILPSQTSEKLIVIFLLIVGSVFTSYLGERIDENGVGQGASVLIAFGILSTIPAQVFKIYKLYPMYKTMNQLDGYWKQVGIITGIFLVMLILSILANKKEYKFPIQSMTNKYRVKAHFFPIKLLASSVMPVIFATAMLTLFSTISTVFNYNWNWVSYTTKQGFAVYVILIFLFSFIYNFIQIDGEEIQEQFNQSGVYFIGHKGTEVSSFLGKQLYKVTWKGAPLLTLIATIAIGIELVAPQQFGLSLTGVSLLIVVGVIQELIHQIKGLTSKHNYKEVF